MNALGATEAEVAQAWARPKEAPMGEMLIVLLGRLVFLAVNVGLWAFVLGMVALVLS